jgi:hypothetical protein
MNVHVRSASADGIPARTCRCTAIEWPALFWKNGEQGAAREGDWKLLLGSAGPKLQLFNLVEDFGEKKDVSAEKPEVKERLHKAWLDWSATLPPRANPPEPKTNEGRPPGGKQK